MFFLSVTHFHESCTLLLMTLAQDVEIFMKEPFQTNVSHKRSSLFLTSVSLDDFRRVIFEK